MVPMITDHSTEDSIGTETRRSRQVLSPDRCLRCGGLMVPEQGFRLFSDSGHLDFSARRCVQCGELVDPVILRNRHLRPLNGLGKSERGGQSSVC